MKLTKDQLRKLKIFNNYDFSNGQPSVYYRGQINGRGYQCAAWIVFDKNIIVPGAWYDYGRKTFNVYNPRLEKETKLNECLEYFKKTYGIEEVAKTPFGDWMEKTFVEERILELTKKLKEMTE